MSADKKYEYVEESQGIQYDENGPIESGSINGAYLRVRGLHVHKENTRIKFVLFSSMISLVEVNTKRCIERSIPNAE